MLAGMASGFTGTTTGVGGPPMALTYQHSDAGDDALDDVRLLLDRVVAVDRCAGASPARSGTRQWQLAALLLPAVGLGVVTARRFQDRLDPADDSAGGTRRLHASRRSRCSSKRSEASSPQRPLLYDRFSARVAPSVLRSRTMSTPLRRFATWVSIAIAAGLTAASGKRWPRADHRGIVVPRIDEPGGAHLVVRPGAGRPRRCRLPTGDPAARRARAVAVPGRLDPAAAPATSATSDRPTRTDSPAARTAHPTDPQRRAHPDRDVLRSAPQRVRGRSAIVVAR